MIAPIGTESTLSRLSKSISAVAYMPGLRCRSGLSTSTSVCMVRVSTVTLLDIRATFDVKVSPVDWILMVTGVPGLILAAIELRTLENKP